MARSINKTIFIGRLGAKPEMRYTPSGRAVTTFSLAMNRQWTNSDGTQGQETEWQNIEFWGRAAEVVNQHTDKGALMYVEGRIKTDRVPARDGQGPDKFFTKIVGQEFMFLSGNREGLTNAAPTSSEELEPQVDDILID